MAVSYTGPTVVLDDFMDRSRSGLLTAEFVALPLLFILLWVIFRGLVAALLPIVTGGLAIVVTFALMRPLTSVVDVNILSLNAISVLCLSISADAALVIVSRFRDELT